MISVIVSIIVGVVLARAGAYILVTGVNMIVNVIGNVIEKIIKIKKEK